MSKYVCVDCVRVLAAGDSPGQVDPDQSGQGESTITTYETLGNDPAPMDEPFWPESDMTGPSEVPSTRAPNVTGAVAPLKGPRQTGIQKIRCAQCQGKGGACASCGGKGYFEVNKNKPLLNASHSPYLAGNEQSGQGESDLDQVEVSDDDHPMYPWEIGLTGDGLGEDAADVASVPTPGGEEGYPQPKSSMRDIDQTRLSVFKRQVMAGLRGNR